MIKLLAVDDEKGITDVIKRTFAPIGFTVFTAQSGPDAIEIVKKEGPKIVFLDIRMPGMDGLQVLAEIKKIDPTIKVIMVTVLDDEGTREAAQRLGADEFVTKPFMPDYLEDVVRRKINELMGGK